MSQLNCVFLGLSITSAWGNGHATTYRALLKALRARGHQVTFLERDMPWYAANREFNSAPYCNIVLYHSVSDLKERFAELVRTADVVVVGSYVPDGIEVGRWVISIATGRRVFYDIDTPITVSDLANSRCSYLSHDLIPEYDLYLSFAGGPILLHLEKVLGAKAAMPLYCSVDTDLYFPSGGPRVCDLGYLGTYAADRQASLNELLLASATKLPNQDFAVAGSQYPPEIQWPSNVKRIEHLAPCQHREFYNSQRFTLNLTRRNMLAAGFSPSVRLFEASACGTPILTDEWEGLEMFFERGSEILTVTHHEDVIQKLQMPEDGRLKIAELARNRTLRFHTSQSRAEEFEAMVLGTMTPASQVLAFR